MREIDMGGKAVTIAASPITLYIYTREFGPKADLIGDLANLGAVETGSLEDIRFIALFKILWAMCKTAKLGGSFPDFETWMKEIDVDLSDEALWSAVMEEAARGLFRSATASLPAH